MQVKLIAYSLPQHLGTVPEDIVEYSARICHKSTDKMWTNPNFITHLIKLGHWGILEHAHAGFEISEVSRALSHQLVRHRLFSYCQQSQRHVKCLDTLEKVIPPSIAANPLAQETYEQAMKSCHASYLELLNMGVPPEDARYVFPNAIHTTLMASGNFRAWLEYFRQRLDKPAQWEIKVMSKAIWQELTILAPKVFTRANLELIIPRDFSILD